MGTEDLIVIGFGGSSGRLVRLPDLLGLVGRHAHDQPLGTHHQVVLSDVLGLLAHEVDGSDAVRVLPHVAEPDGALRELLEGLCDVRGVALRPVLLGEGRRDHELRGPAFLLLLPVAETGQLEASGDEVALEEHRPRARQVLDHRLTGVHLPLAVPADGAQRLVAAEVARLGGVQLVHLVAARTLEVGDAGGDMLGVGEEELHQHGVHVGQVQFALDD